MLAVLSKALRVTSGSQPNRDSPLMELVDRFEVPCNAPNTSVFASRSLQDRCTHIAPFVHCTSSTTSRLACATSCMTCRPSGPVFCPYPIGPPVPDPALPLAIAAAFGVEPLWCVPKMEKAVGTAGELTPGLGLAAVWADPLVAEALLDGSVAS